MERLGDAKASNSALILLVCLVFIAALVSGRFGAGCSAGQGVADASLHLHFSSEVTVRSAEQRAAGTGANPRETAGNNDCILLEYSDARGELHHALIDTGDRWSGDNGETVTISWLKSHGVKRLDWMLITHQHADHMGEAASILENFDVGVLYMKHYDGNWVLRGVTDEVTARKTLGAEESERLSKEGQYYLGADGAPLTVSGETDGYSKILQAAIKNGTPVVGPSWAEVNPHDSTCSTASPDLSTLDSWIKWLEDKAPSGACSLFEPFNDSNVEFDFGPASIQIVNWREYDVNGNEWEEKSRIEHETVFGENQNSLGVVIDVGATRAFLAGDIESRSIWNGIPMFPGDLNDEQRIAEEVGDVDFYKAGHHGANTSSSDYLLDIIKPEACMITNMVDKASTKVIERLENHGCTCIMYTTEDPVETIVELAPDAVRMKRASDDGWIYDSPTER